MSLIDAAVGLIVVIMFAVCFTGALLIVGDKEREYHDRKEKRERKREH